MARTKKVDVGNSGGFKHRTSVGENGEILYDAPVEISSKADMENYGITIEDCSYLHFGGSQKIWVYFLKTTNRVFLEFQWESINNLHSAGLLSSRCMVSDVWCMVSGKRKAYIRFRYTNKCLKCPYSMTPETRQAAVAGSGLDG